MLNVQKLHVPGYCRFMTGTFLRDCVLHVHFVSGLGVRILVLGCTHRSTHRAVLCVVPVLVRYHTHTKVVHEGIKIYYGHIHVKEV